jgi:hypothetical protein
MRYLERLGSNLRPALEAIIIDAQLKFPLGGHFGPESAWSAALPYVRSVCCECAAELCRAVEHGQFSYSELTASLEALKAGIIREAYDRAGLPYWNRYSARADFDAFEREALNWLEHSDEWRAVQTERIRLARTNPPTTDFPVDVPTAFDALMADAKKVLERSQELSLNVGVAVGAKISTAPPTQITTDQPAELPVVGVARTHDVEPSASQSDGPTSSLPDPIRSPVKVTSALRQHRKQLLDDFCKQRGWKRSGLAAITRIDESTIRAITRGDRKAGKFTDANLDVLLKATGISRSVWDNVQ